MPVLVDMSNVTISTLMAQLGKHTNAEISESMLRHMVLNCLRSIRQKFFHQYGELVIATDDKNYWRREYFPYYKAQRRQHREASDIDWKMVFDTLDTIKSELIENFPYKVIQVDGAEADDIIGSICGYYGQQLSCGEKFLIVSSDKDMSQLQKFANIDQWDPIRSRWIRNNTPEQSLFEHVVGGDRGDGIPNVLSKDDVFVSGDRQTPLTKKRIAELKDNINNLNEDIKRNYIRNRTLIDFEYIPSDIKQKIIERYNEKCKNGREKLFNYFIKHRLRNLTEVIQEF